MEVHERERRLSPSPYSSEVAKSPSTVSSSSLFGQSYGNKPASASDWVFFNLRSPSLKCTKSTFGPQPLSQKVTEPSVKFGMADRVRMDKLYMSPELSKCQTGKYGPGPVYEVKSSLGKQMISKNENSPQIRFGAASRFLRERYGEGTPGPGTYNSPSGFGTQVLSYQKSPWFADFGRSTRDQQTKIYLSAEFDKNKFGTGSPGPTVSYVKSSLGEQITATNRTAPRIRFGAEKRFKYNTPIQAASSPGVGQYTIVSSVGKQPESKKNSFPSFSFRHCDRDHREKVFISAEHDKSHYGVESPGPAAVKKNFTSLGQQIDSRKLSSNTPKFGTAARFREHYLDNPGPGEYEC